MLIHIVSLSSLFLIIVFLIFFLFFLMHLEYYTEKDVQEGYKIIAKISQMLEDKQADKRELLLLTYQ